MKNLLYALVSFIFTVPVTNITVAQCNIDDTSSIHIGQVVVDSATCPYSGAITINNITGGGGEYVYEIISGPVIRIVQSQNKFSALPTGNYTVRVSGCNGSRVDTALAIFSLYSPPISNISIYKTSGLICGVSNNGVYTFKKYSSMGKSPYRFQISTTNNFSSIPYIPGTDSVVVTNLSANTTYYLRVTDGCNNTIVTSFNTPVVKPFVALSVPTLSFTLGQYYKCSRTRMLQIDFKDSATGTPFNPELAYFQTPYWWQDAARPHLRFQVKNSATNQVYYDKYRSIVKADWSFAGMGVHYSFNPAPVPNTLPPIQEVGSIPWNGSNVSYYPANIFHPEMFYENINNSGYTSLPVDTPLTVTIFFPGGEYCGTTIPAYNKTYNVTLTTDDTPQPVITSVSPQCAGNTYLRVAYTAGFSGRIKVVEPLPAYTTIVPWNGHVIYSTNMVAPIIGPYITGHTYRVILEDRCGRLDSMDVLFNPGISAAPPPAINNTILKEEKCTSLPTDSIYKIGLQYVPNYSFDKITIDGIPDSLITTGVISLGLVAYTVIQKPQLAPGTYTVRVYWTNNCSHGIAVQNITIAPSPHSQPYADITADISSTPGSCFLDGNTKLYVKSYLKRNSNDYTLSNFRLVGVPNNAVFPLTAFQGTINSLTDYTARFFIMTMSSGSLNDSIYVATAVGLILNPGQEGNYKFAIDIICKTTGDLIETVYKTFTVNSISENRPAVPSLKNSNAMVCDGSTDMTIFFNSIGGKRPLKYEYKLESSPTFLLTANAGADSSVTISPAPAPGTIYDVKVTDSCGTSNSSKVSLGSFTGKFYIYQKPFDCYTDPFSVQVSTSFIKGAYYTWRRNGTLVDQGYDKSSVKIFGVSVDSITVDINIYGCYFRVGARMIVFDNPCNIVILPVANINASGKRLSDTYTQINWTTTVTTENSYFIIEQSTDGINFTQAGTVNANAATWDQSFSFSNYDANPVSYYRICLIDDNNKKKYSSIIPLNNTKKLEISTKIIPNPTTDYIRVFLSNVEKKTYKAIVYNDKGQTMKTINISSIETESGVLVDVSSFAKGGYFISIIDNWEVVSGSKFIVQ